MSFHVACVFLLFHYVFFSFGRVVQFGLRRSIRYHLQNLFMPLVQITLHPRGLHPLQAARAFHLHEEEGMTMRNICDEVTNMSGKRPSFKAVWRAIHMVKATKSSEPVAQTKYTNCGRKRTLTPAEEKKVTGFVKQWRNKRFCTCRYIRAALKLKVTTRTVARVLNRNGYFWRPLPKVRGLNESDIHDNNGRHQHHEPTPATSRTTSPTTPTDTQTDGRTAEWAGGLTRPTDGRTRTGGQMDNPLRTHPFRKILESTVGSKYRRFLPVPVGSKYRRFLPVP